MKWAEEQAATNPWFKKVLESQRAFEKLWEDAAQLPQRASRLKDCSRDRCRASRPGSDAGAPVALLGVDAMRDATAVS